MRLICPNCDAQYEVPVEVIPTSGRDVQCSNCGITWFQHHPDHPPAAPETDDLPAPGPEPDEGHDEDDRDEAGAGFDAATARGAADPADAWDEDEEEDEVDEPVEADLPEDEWFGEDDDDDEDFDENLDGFDEDRPLDDEFADSLDEEFTEDLEEDEEDEEAGFAALPRRRDLDPEVKSVLQEEAEFSRRARVREADPLESQPELGLAEPETEAQRRERESRDRIAELRGMPVPPPPASRHAPPEAGEVSETDESAAKRRDLLPDIEEINSSLRGKGEKPATEPEPVDPVEEVRAQQRGFRTGFGLMMLVTAGLLMLYLRADWVIATFPALEGTVEGYLDIANTFRAWVHARVGELLIWIDRMSTEG